MRFGPGGRRRRRRLLLLFPEGGRAKSRERDHADGPPRLFRARRAGARLDREFGQRGNPLRGKIGDFGRRQSAVGRGGRQARQEGRQAGSIGFLQFRQRTGPATDRLQHQSGGRDPSREYAAGGGDFAGGVLGGDVRARRTIDLERNLRRRGEPPPRSVGLPIDRAAGGQGNRDFAAAGGRSVRGRESEERTGFGEDQGRRAASLHERKNAQAVRQRHHLGQGEVGVREGELQARTVQARGHPETDRRLHHHLAGGRPGRLCQRVQPSRWQCRVRLGGGSNGP